MGSNSSADKKKREKALSSDNLDISKTSSVEDSKDKNIKTNGKKNTSEKNTSGGNTTQGNQATSPNGKGALTKATSAKPHTPKQESKPDIYTKKQIDLLKCAHCNLDYDPEFNSDTACRYHSGQKLANTDRV